MAKNLFTWAYYNYMFNDFHQYSVRLSCFVGNTAEKSFIRIYEIDDFFFYSARLGRISNASAIKLVVYQRKAVLGK